MPDQTTHLTALRARHSGRVYLSRLTGTPILSGTLTATPALPALDLAYTLITGSAAQVQPGMRVLISTSGGAPKATLTIRSAGSISASSLPVREFADLSLNAGDGITVYDDLVLTDKLVSGDLTFAPDHAAYSDQNSSPAPVAVSGGSWVGWIGAAGYVDVPFTGSGSYAVDPDSAGSVTHLWSAPGGSFVSGTSASPDPTIRYASAGSYKVTHTVTDVSNGKSETQHLRVRAHDANDPPDECWLTSIDGDPRAGLRVTVELFEQTDLAALPDLAPVILWTDDANVHGSITPGRSHLLCAGYLRRERARGDADGDQIEFEVIAPLARLAELPGFSKVLLRAESPDAWDEVRGLTVKRAIIQLLRHYTNVLSLFDLYFAGFADCDYSAFYLQKATPYEQVIELADSRDARLTCDRAGRFEVARRLEFTPLADRDALTTTITLTADDLLDYEVSREHGRALETFRARGFTAANEPVFARYPASPGTGSASPVSDRLIADDHADLLARCALRGAWEDRVYIDADGVTRHAPEVRLTLFGAYGSLFQFYREWVKLAGVATLRGVDLGAFRFIPLRVSVDYDHGTATTRLDLRAETYATGAVDDTPAAEVYPPTDPPVTYPPSVVIDPPTDGSGLYANAPTLALILSNGTLKRTSNAHSAYPNWTSLDLTALPGWAGTGIGAFCADPFSPKYIGTGSSVNGWFTTSSRIVRVTNLGGTPVLTVQQTIGTPLNGAVDLIFERGVQNWGMCAVERGIDNLEVHRTTDGATWAKVTADTDYDTTGQVWRSGLAISPHLPGRAYISVMDSTGSSPNGSVLVTTDYGATFSPLTSPAADQGKFRAGVLHVPYASTDMATMFYGYRSTALDWRLYRTVGATTTDISPQHGGSFYGMDNNQNRGLATADDDPNFLILIGTNNALAKRGIWVTTNALAAAPTWTELAAPVTVGTELYTGVYCVGRNAAYFIGKNGKIGYWSGGAVVRSLQGDLTTGASVIGICGL